MNMRVNNISFGIVDGVGDSSSRNYTRKKPTVDSVISLANELLVKQEKKRFNKEELNPSLLNIKKSFEIIEKTKKDIIKNLRDYDAYISEKYKADGGHFYNNNYVERYINHDLKRLDVEA